MKPLLLPTCCRADNQGKCTKRACLALLLQGSGDPAAGEAWMLKMSEWAPQSLGGSMSAAEALDPKGDEGKSYLTTENEPAVVHHTPSEECLH